MTYTNTPTHNIIHPCDSWAKACGHSNWVSALSAMNAGAILAGASHAIGSSSKTNINMNFFMEKVTEAGLSAYFTDEGLAVVGHKQNFSFEFLQMQERAQQSLAGRLMGSLQSSQIG